MKFKQRDKGATNLLIDNKKTHTHIYIYIYIYERDYSNSSTHSSL